MTICDDLFEAAMEGWFESWIKPDLHFSDKASDSTDEDGLVEKAANIAIMWIQALQDHMDVIYTLRDPIEDEYD